MNKVFVAYVNQEDESEFLKETGGHYISAAPGLSLVRELEKARKYNSFASAEKAAKAARKFYGGKWVIEEYDLVLADGHVLT